MFNFLFGSRANADRSSQRRPSSGGAMQRRSARHVNLLVERVSRRDDAAE